MRKATALVLAIIVLFTGMWLLASWQREQYRRAEKERRDLWVFSIKGSLEKGERQVSLYSCSNTDFLLSSIRGMPEVESILFQQTIDLSDVGIAELPTFPHLKHLVFKGERGLKDSNFELLAKCSSLEILELNRTNVTDKGLVFVSQMKTLRTIVLSSEFSYEAVENLRAMRPELVIERRDVF